MEGVTGALFWSLVGGHFCLQSLVCYNVSRLYNNTCDIYLDMVDANLDFYCFYPDTTYQPMIVSMAVSAGEHFVIWMAKKRLSYLCRLGHDAWLGLCVQVYMYAV